MPVTKEVQASLVAQTRKESVCNAGNPGSIPGSGRSLGKGNGNPLQYSCLGNPKDGGAWWAAVDGVAQSQIRLKWLSSSSSSMGILGFPGGSDNKESSCNARDLGLIPGSGRSLGKGNGNPLQYYCLEDSMDRGAWWATVHGVTKSQTQLSN